MDEYITKAFCEIAWSRVSGLSRVSDEFEARTTVTAPILAISIPNRSRYRDNVRVSLKADALPSYIAKAFSQEKGSKNAISHERKLDKVMNLSRKNM